MCRIFELVIKTNLFNDLRNILQDYTFTKLKKSIFDY